MAIINFTNTISRKIQFTNTDSTKLQMTGYLPVVIDATLSDDLLASPLFRAIPSTQSLPSAITYDLYVYMVYNFATNSANLYQSNGTSWVSKTSSGFNGNINEIFTTTTIMTTRGMYLKFVPGNPGSMGLYKWKPGVIGDWTTYGLTDGPYDIEVLDNVTPTSDLLPVPYPAVQGYKAARITYANIIISHPGVIDGIVAGVPSTNTSGSTGSYYLSDNGSVYICTDGTGPVYEWFSAGGYSKILPSSFSTWGTAPIVIYNSTTALTAANPGYMSVSVAPGSTFSSTISYPSDGAHLYYKPSFDNY